MKTTPDDKVWTVYEHITPIGKKYFGITNASDLNLRWANGLGYRTQQVFFRAIVKYGWDNIIHNVIAKDLSLNEAKRMEEELIEKERTNITKYGHQANGYNMTAGGDKIPFYFYWNDEKYRKKMEENVYKKRRIPVDAYDLNGNFIATYKSIRDAEKETGCHAQEISKCIRGLANYTKGYKFSKHKEPIPETNKKYFERQVNMFDFAGNYLKTFKSCAEAARFVNFGTKKGESLIAHCAKGERASYRGYLWSYTDKPFLFQRRRKTREKAIDMYDLNGNFIKRFESMSLARDEIRPGIKSLSALRKCCLGETKSAYGYKWKYASQEETNG